MKRRDCSLAAIVFAALTIVGCSVSALVAVKNADATSNAPLLMPSKIGKGKAAPWFLNRKKKFPPSDSRPDFYQTEFTGLAWQNHGVRPRELPSCNSVPFC